MLGTFVEIAAAGSGGALDAAFAAIERVEHLMSPHRAESDLGKMNRLAASGKVRVDAWTFEVLSRAKEIWAATDGLFDPTRERRFGGVRLDAERTVRFERPLTIDLGGIAKGWAVDRAVEALKNRGVAAGSVNAGGDVRAFGAEAIVLHLRDPESGTLSGRFPLREAAMATTAVYREWSGREGQPGVQGPGAAGLRSVTVRASECWLADALTKVVWLRGEAAIPFLRERGAEACGLLSDGSNIVTPGWASETSL